MLIDLKPRTKVMQRWIDFIQKKTFFLVCRTFVKNRDWQVSLLVYNFLGFYADVRVK